MDITMPGWAHEKRGHVVPHQPMTWAGPVGASAQVSFGSAHVLRRSRELRLSTSILEGAARTIAPPTSSHSPSPARATGQSLVPEARLGYARQSTAKNQMRNSPFRLFKAAQAQGLCSNSSVLHQVLPNPSFKRTPNGVARQPSSAGASPHFALAVWRATPPGSA
jgi:hypothetical protein